jgi:hypothetical protein
VIATILRWSTRILLTLLLLAIVVIAGFRLTAALRENGARDELAPSTGHLVPTSSGGVFVQEKDPANGIPVVLFHGSVAWSEFWRRTIDTLAAAGFRVIALDVPPFGFSDRPGGDTRSDQAVRVNDVLRNLQAPLPAYIEVLQKPWVLREYDGFCRLAARIPWLGENSAQCRPSVLPKHQDTSGAIVGR